MKELSLALTLILTGLGMSQSKQFNPVPHAPPAAVEGISAGTDNPAPQATVATVAPADDQAVALLDENGPTPLTEAEFADLQKWLKDGNEAHTWVHRTTAEAERDRTKRHVALAYVDKESVCSICNQSVKSAIHMLMPPDDWSSGCITCRGTGLRDGRLCPTCDGATNPSLFNRPDPGEVAARLREKAKNSTRYTPPLAEQMLATANRIGPYRSLDPALCQAAQQYADHLARTRQQGHFADQGPEERAKRAGFTGSLRGPVTVIGPGQTKFGLGEVLAFGHPDVEAAFEGWMNSKGHREALQEPLYDVAGFGRNGRVFVGLFGNSQAAPPKLAAAAPQSFQQCQPGQPCYRPSQQPANRVRYQYQPRRAILPWRR